MDKQKKKYTEEQLREAIEHSDYTYTSVANYLARHFSADRKCTDKTAKQYIRYYRLGAEIEGGEMEITALAYGNIKNAIKRGDTKTSKWWLERTKRERFGNEVTVHQKTTDPLNINLQGELFSEAELKQSSMVEVPEYGRAETTES